MTEIAGDVCRHENLGFLGEGGPAGYFRCRTCGTYVIEQGGHLWLLRSFAKPRAA